MRRTILLCLTMLSSLALANPGQHFDQGTLIIPMQANFQSDCGATSSYGLVWKLLYENRPGGAFSGNPVTIYWVINDGKDSPNRCVPTNKHASPSPSGMAAGVSGWDTGVWNDGCDLTIPNNTGSASSSLMPVVPVDYAASWPVSGLYPTTNSIVEFDTTGTLPARPGYDTGSVSAGKGKRPASGSLDNTGTCGTPCTQRFTKIQYSGGLFIIDALDAKRVILAMQNAVSYPHLNLHTLNNGLLASNRCGFSDNSTYKVYMHQATQGFDAPIYKRMTSVPPKIALLDFGGGIKTVLQGYLQRAGLTGNIGGLAMGGTPGYSTPTSGLLFDRLEAINDLVSTGTYPKGYLNSKIGSKSRYKVFWAPHWAPWNSSIRQAGCTTPCNDPGTNAGACGGSCNATPAQVVNAMENIAYFADQKGNGVMAECASIQGFEGSEVGDLSPTALTTFQFTNNTTPLKTITHNSAPLSTSDGRNCSDPDYLALSTPRPGCTVYPEAGEPFSQVGDFALTLDTGTVSNFRPSTGGSPRPNVKRLAHSWLDFNGGSPPYAGDYTGDKGWDYFTLNQKDDDPEKATIIYIGGHDLTGNVSGTRVVLNTLLNLGADPIAADRNFAQPVGLIDTTNSNIGTMLSSIYQSISGTLLPGTISWSPSTGKNWMFPYTRGGIRAKNVDGLVAGQNELNDAVMWSGEGEMPLPATRNLFTYFGGQVSTAALSGGRRVKNDVAQIGWVPERIEYTRLNSSYGTSPNPGCVDVQKYGDYKDKVSGANTGGLVPGPDGICDLQQAMMWSNFAWTMSGSNHTVPPGHLAQLAADVAEAKQVLQMVRGFCYATDLLNNPIYAPTDAECIDTGAVSADNRAHMGGAVRGSPAVVTASTRIAETVARPTVAYIGTWDGQLHAVYVGGGAGYVGPTDTMQYLNADAQCSAPATCTNTFKTNWSTKFAASTLPNRGTELWSYLPASQLPFLRGNNARVDSTPAVQDVFVDLYGDGTREWHTILVVSLGGSAREIFAMDVTNPLKPALLWDIVGSNAQIGSFPDFSAVARSDYDITGNSKPLNWDNTLTDYILPPVNDPGRTFGWAYDFNELGGSRAVSIGQMREGLEPTYAVFVSSNASGYGAGANDANGRSMSKGIVVHALDIATGQKLWQWNQPYVNDNTKPDYRLADNSVPTPVAVANGVDGASTLYVGDMEGRLWELNAATGQNLSAMRDLTLCNTTACNFAAFDTKGTQTSPQPITSGLAIAKMPPAATGPLASYTNENVLLFGTAGVDWVPPAIPGAVHSLLLETNRRKPTTADGTHLGGSTWLATDAVLSAKSLVSGEYGGVLQEPSTMPLALDVSGGLGHRVYGNLSVAGQVVYVPTVLGPGGDPMSVARSAGGATLELNLGAMSTTQAAAELPTFNLASFGGVATFSLDRGGGNFQSIVVGDQISKTSTYKPTAVPPAGDIRSPKKSLGTNESLPYRLYNTVRRFFSQQ